MKRLAEKLRVALARHFVAHGVDVSDEITAAIANNLVYAVVEAVIAEPDILAEAVKGAQP